MTAADQPHNLPNTNPDAAKEARAQADAYDSLFANIELELDGGDTITIPPHPDYGMLDDDRMAEYEQLLFEADTEYEREPDIIIPDKTLDSGSVVPGETLRGALKRPYRRLIDNKPVLVTPPYSVRVVSAALGEAEYKRLRGGGKSAADVWKIWGKQGLALKERQAGDSKSDGSTVDLAAVPETDSE